MGAAWPRGQHVNVINGASGFLSLCSVHGSDHEKKKRKNNGKKRGGKIRRDRAPSGENNFSPEFSTVHSGDGFYWVLGDRHAVRSRLGPGKGRQLLPQSFCSPFPTPIMINIFILTWLCQPDNAPLIGSDQVPELLRWTRCLYQADWEGAANGVLINSFQWNKKQSPDSCMVVNFPNSS